MRRQRQLAEAVEELVRQIATELWRPDPDRRSAPWQRLVDRGAPSDARIQKALAYMMGHPNGWPGSSEMASEASISRAQFYTRFKLCTSLTPHVFVNLPCVEAAIAALATVESPLESLRHELGFSAATHFIRLFRQRVGIPPGEYRRSVVVPDAHDPRSVPITGAPS